MADLDTFKRKATRIAVRDNYILLHELWVMTMAKRCEMIAASHSTCTPVRGQVLPPARSLNSNGFSAKPETSPFFRYLPRTGWTSTCKKGGRWVKLLLYVSVSISKFWFPFLFFVFRFRNSDFYFFFSFFVFGILISVSFFRFPFSEFWFPPNLVCQVYQIRNAQFSLNDSPTIDWNITGGAFLV